MKNVYIAVKYVIYSTLMFDFIQYFGLNLLKNVYSAVKYVIYSALIFDFIQYFV